VPHNVFIAAKEPLMSYVVYNKETTRYLTFHPKVKTHQTGFASEGAAKAALTREVNRGAVKREDFAIADSDTFHASIEKKVTKMNLMNGKPFQQTVNTPRVSDPSTELYWSV
jgi:hypothetical protein